MAERKLLAGHAVRRVRRQAGLTQAACAQVLGISPSYLNLVERNQRPVSAPLLVRLAEQFDFDPRTLAAAEPGGGAEALRRRLADPMFADLAIDRAEVEDWLAAAPGGAEAFARAFDRPDGQPGAVADEASDPGQAARREIERWRNHFPDLDAQAETLADELRVAGGDPFGAMAERLRVKHQLSIRVLPVDVMPGRRVRLDLHARQLQLSEVLDAPSRAFALARRLGAVEARAEVDALVRGAALTDRSAQRLFHRHLTGYFAAAVLMPYARFLRACEGSGYDLALLGQRFGTSHEQVAHRLTTLQRVGARGLPFFMLRTDRAGQVSKRFAGASGSPLPEGPGICPLWSVFAAFARADETVAQLVEALDGTAWFTLSKTVGPVGGWTGGVRARFAVSVGLSAAIAQPLAAARGVDLSIGMPIGPGCRACTRPDCAQRSASPAGRTLVVSESDLGVTPFAFVGD